MKTAFRIMLLVGLLCTSLSVTAQQPILSYILSVNPNDTSSVQISMRLRNLPVTFHLAMVKHFLVDDGYWRYVEEELQIAPGTIAREQNGLWRVRGAGSDAMVRYKIRLGEKGASRVVRKPFLTPTGGLLGDLHICFMFRANRPFTLTLRDKRYLLLGRGRRAGVSLAGVPPPSVRPMTSLLSDFSLTFRERSSALSRA